MLGLKPCKVVVLVFSKDAQASEYVNNGSCAFDEKSLLFNKEVDDSFPEGRMEFHLSQALTQWLITSPSALKGK